MLRAIPRGSAIWAVAVAGLVSRPASRSGLSPAVATAAEPAIEFNRDIRPILSENCSACHGPDARKREAGLRLDRPNEATSTLGSGKIAIVPGKPDQSELVRRITTADADERMPPADSNKQLTPEQIDLLRRWIAAGAPMKGIGRSCRSSAGRRRAKPPRGARSIGSSALNSARMA